MTEGTPPTTSRRKLLRGAASCGLAGLLTPSILGALLGSRPARAASGQLRFIFVLAPGGWDTTRAFTPAFDNELVDMEAQAQPGQVGDLRFVDHPERPSVRGFFQEYGPQTLLINGILVPSVAHRSCMRLLLTGSAADGQADWPAHIAAGSSDWIIPHLVLDGPAFPGAHGGSVVRVGTGGQLAGMLDGSLLGRMTPTPAPLSDQLAELVDTRARQRSTAALNRASTPRDRQLAGAHDEALSRALRLKEQAPQLPWDAGDGFSGQVELAVACLSRGLARCCGLSFAQERDWDSHYLNDERQGPLFEALFSGLSELLAALESTPGPQGAPLSEDTLVVVLSEMGRTPLQNASKGKDHWPYTSAMLVGPGLRGGRVVGQLDEGFAGMPVDPDSGQVDSGGEELTGAHLGATLVALAGLDPAEILPQTPPLWGLLA